MIPPEPPPRRCRRRHSELRARAARPDRRPALALAARRIAELTRRHAGLAERERVIQALTDTQPALLAYWDRDLRCRFANRACREFFGRSAGEIDGRTMRELFGAERLDQLGIDPRSVFDGQPLRAVATLRDAAGQLAHAQIAALPDLVGGQVVGLLLILDLSESKLAEQRLQQMNAELAASRDKAEAATRAKSAFLANMGHEIRTPLNVILGITHLLRRDAHDALEAERLDKVDDAATQLLEVINDILDLSRIESGHFELESIGFSLRDLIARGLAQVDPAARAKGLALVADVRVEPDLLRGDPARLAQALLNLLSNAVKFTEAGSVSVRCETVEPGGDTLALRFTVVDTGIGIESDHLGRLFDAFVQADASPTRRFGGTGLGLAITRRLAELMGGQVGVRSVPGQGSEFWFTARVAPATEPVAVAGDPGLRAVLRTDDEELALRRHHAGARVLLAEDNPVNQGAAIELLKAVGMAVDLADNGAEAIARTRLNRYDLVLMDLQMPVMGGLDATRALRTLPATAEVPILAMSSDTTGNTRLACQAAGVNALVAKPLSPATLYPALLRWLPPRPTAEAPPPARGTAGAGTTPAGPVRTPGPAIAQLPAEGIRGLDIAEGLVYVGGRQDVYLRVLRHFVQHYGRSLSTIGEHLSSGAADRIRSAAHSIRGAAASIGAKALAARAAHVEAAMAADRRPAGDAEASGQALLLELERVICAIDECLGPQEEPAAAAGHSAVSAQSLLQLEQLLAVGDYRATAQYRELAAGLHAAFGPPAEAIGVHLRNFEFGLALAALRELRARQSG